MSSNRKISILGSTGSIGIQTLQVIDAHKEVFELLYLTANRNTDTLELQALRYNPRAVVIADEKSALEFKKNTSFRGRILTGSEGVAEAAADSDNDLVVSALVGFSGVAPTYNAVKNGIDVALANKETLVSAGNIITETAKKHGANLLAVDSEHNAILQCIAGEKFSQIEKLILTASGGPFRDTPFEEFRDITIEDALNHPNWSMGSKITIDSATMMNKGFEIIEAYWLFGIPVGKIDVTVHPQSIIHSMVQFIDGSVKAQLGLPDMRIPISYALNYPERFEYDFPRMDITQIGRLDFYKPDTEKYKCLGLAYQSLEYGGLAPTVLNAANEIAVHNFLSGKIRFLDIPEIIDKTLENRANGHEASLSNIIESDRESREYANSLIDGK